MKKIVSYNVNGIRSALRKGLAGWISDERPDILCLQELKAQENQIDNTVFEDLGYHTFWFPAQKKGYSGVAVITLQQPDNVVYGMNIKRYDDEGRFIRADFGDISVVSVYFPSGSNEVRQEFKMKWLDDFRLYINDLRKTRKKLIICGDFNICRLWIDIHNPEKQQNTSGFLPEERQWFATFVDDGYIDTFREFDMSEGKYSWWSFRAASRQRNKGWRIDYIFITPELRKYLKYAGISSDIVHSDHCPVWIETDL